MAAQAPGVLIQELPTTSLSVRTSVTAVPVFIGNFLLKDAVKTPPVNCTRINNLLDFQKKYYVAQMNLIAAETGGDIASLPGPQPTGSDLVTVSNSLCRDGGEFHFEISAVEKVDGSNQIVFKYESGTTLFPGDGYEPIVTFKYSDGKEDSFDFSKINSSDWIYYDWTKGATSATLIIRTKKPGVLKLKMCFAYSSQYRYPVGIAYDLASLYTDSAAYAAVELYFKNGGGPCYILPLADGSDTELASLPDVILRQAPDATLLVCPGTDDSLKQLAATLNKYMVYSALGPLLQDAQGYFLLADSPDGTTIPDTERRQTAVYYPALHTCTFFSATGDGDIKVTGYWDAAVNNLVQLQTVEPAAYRVIRQNISPQHRVLLPPSAAIAGAFCQSDRARGVWKAPANIPLKGVEKLATVVSETEHGVLNEQGINVIRQFPNNRSPIIYGARTLAVDSDEWCYIQVRRLFNMAERDIRNALAHLLFEANYPLTWERARAAIGNYLAALWRQGALQGNSEQEAFYVQAGLGSTMTQQQVDAGQLIVKIGMAAVRPAEFIILQFTQELY